MKCHPRLGITAAKAIFGAGCLAFSGKMYHTAFIGKAKQPYCKFINSPTGSYLGFMETVLE